MLRTVAAALAAVLYSPLLAQGIDPVGRVHPNAMPLAGVQALAVPALDRAAIVLEDAQRHQNGQPARYAIPFPVTASATSHGTWEQLGDWSLWRLRIQAPEASHVNLGFSTFHLPPSARFMIYSSDYTSIVRPFDASDHSPTGALWTPVVGTAEIVAEVYVLNTERAQVQLALVHVGSGYRFFGAGPSALGTDGSGTCNVDVACPQGLPWANEVSAVTALSSGGFIFCTGFMVNNTSLDGRNYVMTAHHCGVTAGVAPTLVAYWNYEESTCGGSGAPLTQFNTGSTLRASFATSDFTLVELTTAPNVTWGVTFAGWNRGTGNNPSTTGTGIHHPSGDSKKISREFAQTYVTSYGGGVVPGDGSHVLLLDWDDGVTEPGSSGSPLFDQNHRVIGQLHGGSSACGLDNPDWYGRFATSWTGGGTNATRLSNWLDPLNTGAMVLNTFVPISATATSYGVGCYNSRASFAQTFSPTLFDLGGTAVTTNVIQFVPTTNGYTIQAGPDTWFTPVSANLALGDEALATLNLPFQFAFPGGSTNVVRMCSNGYVWMNGATATIDPTPTFVELSNGVARLAPFWMNLNPALGGTTHFDVDPSNNAVYLTWLNVLGVPGGAAPGNTFQMVLRSDNTVEYRYRQISNQFNVMLVGWSRGATLFPPNIDISTAMPFSVGLDLNPLSWAAVGRPILGTTQTINLGNIANPAQSIGLTLIGFASHPIPPDLSIIGAPGCFLHVQSVVIEGYLVGGVLHPWQLAIPANASLSGTHLFTQGALLTNGVNPFGVLTSNGVDLLLGTL